MNCNSTNVLVLLSQQPPATGVQAPKHLPILGLGLEALFLLFVQFKEGLMLSPEDASKGFDYLGQEHGLHDSISSLIPGF